MADSVGSVGESVVFSTSANLRVVGTGHRGARCQRKDAVLDGVRDLSGDDEGAWVSTTMRWAPAVATNEANSPRDRKDRVLKLGMMVDLPGSSARMSEARR
jgi:hypothetical protein